MAGAVPAVFRFCPIEIGYHRWSDRAIQPGLKGQKLPCSLSPTMGTDVRWRESLDAPSDPPRDP
jgi:hypothetical protein